MRSRNEGIDILKFLCAFLVICIHIPFPGHFGECIKAVARIAVPIFFISSGYFFIDTNRGGTSNRYEESFIIANGKKRLLKILKLIVLSNSLYFMCELVLHFIRRDVWKYLSDFLHMSMWKDIVIFNYSPFCESLWYLNAILYSLAIIIVFDKLKCRKILYVLSPFLMVADLLLGKYSIFVFGKYFPNMLTRNWLFFGIPNVSIGMLIKELHVLEKVKKYLKIFILLSTVGLFCLIGEYEVLNLLGVKANRDNYISAAFLSVISFISFASVNQATGKVFKKCAEIGRKTTTGIYIIHSFFISILTVAFGLDLFSTVVGPIIVFSISLVTIILMQKAKDRKFFWYRNRH